MRAFLKSVPVIVLALLMSSCGTGVVAPSVTPPGTPLPSSVVSPSPTQTSPAGTPKTVTFDFDTGLPAVTTRQSTPFDQTSGGVTAHFSSQFDPAGFSVQNHDTTFFNLSQFSGNFLMDSNSLRNPLYVSFSHKLTAITFTFATMDYHDPGAGGEPSSVKLTAYLDSTGTSAVGTVTTHGTFSNDSYPEGTLLFSSGGQLFNLVVIELPFLPQGATDFMVDNISVTTAP